MRSLCVLSLASLLLVACESTPKSERPVIDEATARRAVVDAWGDGLEAGRYDVLRELSPEEQKLMDEEMSKKAGTKLHVSGHVFTSNAPAEHVVDEVRKLRPGRALSFCRTWHVEKRSGDVVEMGSERPKAPVPFAVVRRDKDGRLVSSRFSAMSHEEALSHR